MFVHSGAALHRHEFSAPLEPRSSSVPRRPSLPRAAFSQPISRRASTYEQPSSVVNRPARPRPLSELPLRRITEPVVRFQGSETETMSNEDARSVTNSETSEVTSAGTKSRRRVRTSTTFQLAHPAPTLTQKQRLIHIRPRLLMQLQRLRPETRPEPAIDVLPSAAVIPRLAQKFPRMFRGKAVLGLNDVVLVRSEEYESPESSATEGADSDGESIENRDMMAVICQMPKDAGGLQGKAEIVLSDGSVWVGTPLPNGLYEFFNVDENGNKTTARWVKRSTRRNSADFSASAPGACPLKYTFSIIDPNSRRHPIMGTLTQSTLDIPDFYTSVSASAKKYPPTSHIRPLFGEHDAMDDEPTPERTTHAVGEDVKKLVQVTGIWVALREGLSPYFKYNDSMASGSISARCRESGHGRARSVSLTPEPGRPALSPNCTNTPESGHNALAAVGKLRRSRTAAPTTAPAAPTPQIEVLKAPQRSTSAGTAFMQRVAARRSWRQQSIVHSDSSDADSSASRRPRRSMTEYGSISSPPASLMLPGSSTTTPLDTPTRSQRRVQSAYAPTTLPQILQTFAPAARQSAEHHLDHDHDPDLDLDWVVKPKISRWKTFTNFFRRSHTQSA